MSQYVYNKYNTTWSYMESALYGIYALVVFTSSLRSLVRFLIRQQLVRKYRTPALSMKYSLFILP